MKLDLIKTAFKEPTIFKDLPEECLDGIEIQIIKEYYKQTKFISEPSLKTVIKELNTPELEGALRGFVSQISKASVLTPAETELALFKLRTQAQFKVVEQMYLLQQNEKASDKDFEELNERLQELKNKKAEQLDLPVNAKQYDKLQRAEEEEIWLNIDWLKNNEVPIKKKVLYSFIATTNGGKTILKTWFAFKLIEVGQNVLYLAQEEPYSDTIRRIYQTALGITESQYKEKTKETFEDVGKEFTKLSEERGYGNIYVAEWPGVKVSKIKEYLKRHKKDHEENIDALIVDYGKLVETDSPKKNSQEWERIGLIFKELKELAMKSNIAVITSIQLNRESSKALVEKGQTADLFDVAGAYEATHHVNYCWSVKLTYPDAEGLEFDLNNPNTIKGKYELTVQKQKYGNLRKGDSREFTWLSDHSLDEITITDMDMTDAVAELNAASES